MKLILNEIFKAGNSVKRDTEVLDDLKRNITNKFKQLYPAYVDIREFKLIVPHHSGKVRGFSITASSQHELIVPKLVQLYAEMVIEGIRITELHSSVGREYLNSTKFICEYIKEDKKE